MTNPGDVTEDRRSLPDVIYVEDGYDYVATWDAPQVIKNGLGKTVTWYRNAEDALFFITKERRLNDIRAKVEKGEFGWNDQDFLPEDKAEYLRGAVDLKRIAGKTFIFDHNLAGNMRGAQVMQVIYEASKDLPPEERPVLIASMSSDPEVIEKSKFYRKWDEYGVEVIHKLHYSLFLVWMGKLFSHDTTRFNDWLRAVGGVDYRDRGRHQRELQRLSENAQSITETIRYLPPDNPAIGLLARLTDDQLAPVLRGESLSRKEEEALIQRWAVESSIKPPANPLSGRGKEQG